MQVVSINLREEQLKFLEHLKTTGKIMNKSEFFRRLFDQEIYKIVTLYERFGILTESEVYKRNGI